MEEINETLSELGLTSLQVKVYLALNRLNQASVKDISYVLKVARQEIYRALAELLRLGLIEKRITAPNQFRAIPLEQVLGFLLERKRNQMSKLEEKTARIVKTAGIVNTAGVLQKTNQLDYDFLLFDGKEILLRSAVDFFASSQTIRIINESNLSVYWWINQFQLFANALKRGAKIQVLIDKPQENNPAIEYIRKLKKSPSFGIRYLQSAPSITFIVYDQMGILVIMSTNEALTKKDYFPPCLCSNHPAFIELLQNYFEDMWNNALEYKPEKTKTSRKQIQKLTLQ
jgi:sugar-specific transcriptional regulator TrmB